ncbi:hypothetical protein V9L05_09270 [Bernardetia sp. Wsw4-3y2]|uniref:hypothetical protein n=1 Tax=Bernardetia sp. Wsw4-3y2 TaxID=3127471 RepID=UPI0030CE6F5A
MIIYGTGSKHLKTKQPKDTCCPLCKSEDSVLMSVYSRHAHIFWIPLFPFGKMVAMQCQNCQEVLDKKNVPEHLKTKSQELKKETTTPAWQFIGLLLIALLIGGIAYSDYQSEQNFKSYLKAPQKNDVYKYTTEVGMYSTFKVIEVSKDSILVVQNEYEVNKASGISDIDIDPNYAESLYMMAKKDIQQMYETNKIYDIDRE